MYLKPRFQFLAIVACALLVMFPLSASPAHDDASTLQAHGIAVANMDRSIVPGDDFYDYANGAWIKRTEIPLDRAGVGVFTRLGDLTNERAAALIKEQAKAKAPAGSIARQIADLYNSYMD